MGDQYELAVRKYTNFDRFLNDLELDINQRKIKTDDYFDTIEAEINEDGKKLKEQIEVYQTTSENFEALIDKVSVYRKASQLSANVSFNIVEKLDQDKINKMEENMIIEEGGGMRISDSQFRNISGVVKAEDEMKMKRMIFRTSRGMAVPTFFDMDEDVNLGLKV